MEKKCVWCNSQLGTGKGFVAIGEFGNWVGRKIYMCDFQCLLLWDTDRPKEPYKGKQALDLSNAHLKMKRL